MLKYSSTLRAARVNRSGSIAKGPRPKGRKPKSQVTNGLEAKPLNSILREIESLVVNGSYTLHPSLGATGTDMTYEIAQAMATNTTYGWLVATAPANSGLHGGTAQASIAGNVVTIGGDIIVSIDDKRITSLDDLSTYLEENTLPNETINVGIVRNNQSMTIAVKLGSRPAPT